MANAKKGKVTGGRKGKRASNRGGSNGGPTRLDDKVVMDGEDVLVDTDSMEDGVSTDEKEAEDMRERLRSLRSRESSQSGSGQSGSKEAQE